MSLIANYKKLQSTSIITNLTSLGNQTGNVQSNQGVVNNQGTGNDLSHKVQDHEAQIDEKTPDRTPIK
jgi:hypothetical protein